MRLDYRLGPKQDLSRIIGNFDYPGVNFKFSYSLSAEKGAMTKELERGKTYEIAISGEGKPTIKVSLMSKDISDFFGEATNPKGFRYRKFVDNNNFTHLRFYDHHKMVDVTLSVPDSQTYVDEIVASFQFNSGNPNVNE